MKKLLWGYHNLLLLLIFIIPSISIIYANSDLKQKVTIDSLKLEKDFDVKIINHSNIYSKSLAPPAYINQNDKEYDIDVLLYSLDKAYIGKYYLPDNQYKTLREDINDLKYDEAVKSPDILATKLKYIFKKVSDNHLYIDVPARNLTANNRAIKKSPGKYSVTNKKINDKSILYVKINTMLLSENDLQKLFSEINDNKIYSSDGLIIDLRNNAGGYVHIAEKITMYLKGHKIASNELISDIAVMNSSEAIVSNMNNYILRFNIDKNFNKKSKNFNSLKYYNKLKEFDEYIQNNSAENTCKITKTPPLKTDKEYHKPYNKPILLVLNDKTASTAELTTLLLKQNFKDALIVGQNSSGTLENYDPGLLALPKSKLLIHIPTKHFNFNPGVNFKEKVGITPDVQLKDEKMIDDYINNWILDIVLENATTATV